jgi:hypothetical protein
MMVTLEGKQNPSKIDFSLKGKWRVLTAPKYHCLIWRGDVVHRGVGYAKLNVRLFSYVDSVLHFRQKHSVFEVERSGKKLEADGANTKRMHK